MAQKKQNSTDVLASMQKYDWEHTLVKSYEKKIARAKYAVHGYSKVFYSEIEAIRFAESLSVSRNQVLMIGPPGLLQKNFDTES